MDDLRAFDSEVRRATKILQRSRHPLVTAGAMIATATHAIAGGYGTETAEKYLRIQLDHLAREQDRKLEVVG